MKATVYSCVIALAAALVGCESMGDAASSVREKFAERNAPQTRSYSATHRAVFDAAKATAEQMGYRVVKAGAAQGTLEAISGVRGGERVGSSRQLSMKVKLEGTAEGPTTVAVRITEIIEADSSNRAGVATETPLRDTPQYSVFFEGVERALKVPPRGGS